jgi:hypothetical protein
LPAPAAIYGVQYKETTSARRVIPFPDDRADDNRRIADEGSPMSNHTYRVVEIVGSSPEGVDAAIRNGIARASQTTRNLDWFEVLQIRGQLADGNVAHVQVTMKVGFRMEDA